MDLKCGKYPLVFACHVIVVSLALKLAGCICPCLSVGRYVCFVELTVFFLVSVLTFRYSKRLFLNHKVHPVGKAVFITGCDSGFGHQLARRLDSRGFRVFAGCLLPSGDGARALQESCTRRMHILELDVTKDDSVKRAAEHVGESLGGDVLWAIVNNAGINSGYLTEFSPIESFQKCLEVNTLGGVRTVKAFLPLLKKSKGRIVNVTSYAGRQIFPYATPYTMSKYASVAFNDCLQVELDVWGIRVISIEPDFFKTNLTNKERLVEDIDNTMIKNNEDTADNQFAEDLFNKIKAGLKYVCLLSSPRLAYVVDSMDSAATDVYPADVYRPSGFVLYKVTFYITMQMCSPVRNFFYRAVHCLLGLPKPKTA